MENRSVVITRRGINDFDWKALGGTNDTDTIKLMLTEQKIKELQNKISGVDIALDEYDSIKQVQNKRIKFIVHKHVPRSGSLHFDLRIGDPKNNKNLLSFAFPKNFDATLHKKSVGVKTRDHDPRWLTLKSYRLSEFDSGECIFYVATKKYYDVEFFGKILKGRYKFFRISTKRGDNWILYSSSITEHVVTESLDFSKSPYIIMQMFPINHFVRDVEVTYRTKKIASFLSARGIKLFGRSNVMVHRFFIPDLIYILSKLPKRSAYLNIIEELINNTWYTLAQRPNKRTIDYSAIDSDIVFKLKSYQKDFIDLYDEKKSKLFLHGYILGFEQGLGKTLTSLCLMHGLHKDCVIIFAPKSILNNVWRNEIQTVFKNKQDCWVVGDPLPTKPVKYYIFNYESISKIQYVLHLIQKSTNIGIIVDECHHFRHANTKRTKELLQVKQQLGCKDILMMSGTPIKALGTEMIPVLKLIDPLFDNLAESHFRIAFGLNTEYAIEILKNRLGMMMHRKIKQDVLKLPNKYEIDIKIKIQDGDYYTTDNVQKIVVQFISERSKYYKDNFKMYNDMYDSIIEYLKKQDYYLKNRDFDRYLKIISILRNAGYNKNNKDLVEEVRWANEYEKSTIYPTLPDNMKKDFKRSKSVVKYVDLKIMGEVIGGLLNRLRSKLYSDMIKRSGIEDIIKKATKKSVLFTTYVDVAEEAEKFVKTKKFNPVLVYGKTTGNITPLLTDFKQNDTNPLIATIQTLSTGVTLTNANTVIFLNKPWRYVDYQQASDRVHRIGQDDDVYIYSLILDTGKKHNLSTRMEEIVKWSKDLFEGMVGSEVQSINT